jgi:hypothetical protein
MATALYYRCLHDNIKEPALQVILKILAGEEARHGTFFGDLVKIYLDQDGERSIDRIKQVLDEFEMPLASTMDRYRRHAIKMRQAAGGYDYRQAFAQFKNMVQKHLAKASGSISETWQAFLDSINQL